MTPIEARLARWLADVSTEAARDHPAERRATSTPAEHPTDRNSAPIQTRRTARHKATTAGEAA